MSQKQGGPVEPLRPHDPRQVGAFRLTGRLGTGGMGQVFLGESPEYRQVAVKLLKAEHAYDPRFRQRFAREVAAAKMVSGAHTATVVDADSDGDPPWLATVYIPGPSLLDAVSRGGRLSPDSVRRLGAGLAQGLSAIHACGLVHRDLKPANIILADEGPKIIDFGLVRVEGVSSLTSAGTVVGTYAYMSPEQIAGEEVDARSDVFSLGAVLAYAATGRGPFDAPTVPAVATRIASGPPALDGIDGPLHDFIAACLAKDPAARPTLDAAASYLEQPQTHWAERVFVLAPLPTVPDAPTEILSESPPPRRGRPSGAGMAAAALIVVAGVGIAATLVTGADPFARQSPTPATAPPAPATSAPPARRVPPAHSRPRVAPTHAPARKTGNPHVSQGQGSSQGNGNGDGNDDGG